MKAYQKWLIGIGLFFFVVAASAVYVHFYKTPYAKQRAMISLESYLMKTYPFDYYEVKDGAYDYKKDVYSFTVISNENRTNPVQMKVSAEKDYKVLNNAVHTLKEDQDASKRLRQQADTYVSKQLAQQLSNVLSVSSTIDVVKSDISNTLQWEPGFRAVEVPKGIQYEITLDATSYTNEQMYEDVKKIYERFNDLGIQTNQLQIIGSQFVDGQPVDVFKTTILGNQFPTMKDVAYQL